MPLTTFDSYTSKVKKFCHVESCFIGHFTLRMVCITDAYIVRLTHNSTFAKTSKESRENSFLPLTN